MSNYKIDQLNVYEALGQEKFIALSTAFYTRVYADDEDPAFRSQFNGRSFEAAVKNQWEFFAQRMGGPQFYTTNRAGDRYGGHPALRARHRDFVVNTHNAERWLHHMALALNDVGIGGTVREAMWEVRFEILVASALSSWCCFY